MQFATNWDAMAFGGKTLNEYLWKAERWDAQSLFLEEQWMQQWKVVEMV